MNIESREFPVLIGLHKNDAYKILADFRRDWRLVEDTGRVFYIPDGPHKPERINLYIQDDIIVGYKFF